MANNVSIDTAKANAKKTVAKVFKINLDNTDLESLDITNENNSTASNEEKAANTQLLKISAALLSTEDPEETLKSLAEDLSDGQVDDQAEDTFKELKEKESEIKLEDVAKRMKSVIKVDTIPDNDDFLNGMMSLNNSIEFIEELEASTSTTYESNTVNVSGIYGTSAATISITGGEFSINGAAYSSVETTINNNDTLTIRATSSSSYDTLTTATVSIGGVEYDYDIVTESDPFVSDTKIKAFDFVSKTKQALSTSVTSDAVEIEGINEATAISIVDGTYQISTDSGTTWSTATSSAGTVNAGDLVRVIHTTSSSYKTRIKTVVTFGSGDNAVKADFKSYTLAQDKTPEAFTFATKYDVPVYDSENPAYVEFDSITVTGITGSIRVRINDGEVKVGNGQWRNEEYTLQNELLVSNNQTVTVRHRASSSNNTKVTSSVGIGTKVAEFISYTELEEGFEDIYIEEFLFEPKFDVELNSEVESEEITISGIDAQVSVSVENGLYSINGGTYTNEAGTVSNGDKLKVKHTSSVQALESVETTLKVGEYEDVFISFTKAPSDLTPYHVFFKNKNKQALSTVVESEHIYVRGINADASISIAGDGNPEYNIGTFNEQTNQWEFDSNNWTSINSVVSDNTAVKVRHTTSSSNDTTSEVLLTVGQDPSGNASKPFKFITKTAPSAPTETTGSNNVAVTSVVNGQTYRYAPKYDNVDEWKIENRPEWASFNKRTGELKGKPNKVSFEKIYSNIIITAKNAGGDTALTAFNIEVTGVTPTITTGTVQQQYSIHNDINIQVSVNDTPDDTHTFALSGAPSFLSINNSGLISANKDDISVSDKGAHTFNVTVEDSTGKTSSKEISFEIIEFSNVATPPTITGKPAITIAEDSAYSFTPSASDINSNNLTYNIQNKPSWATFNTTTGALTGTPTNEHVGTHSNIIISVSESGDTTSLPAFNIEVTNTNDTPTTSDVSYSLNTTTSSSLTRTLSANDVDANETFTFTKVSETSNGSVTLNSNGSFTYTPNANFIGSDSFTFKANDGEADSNTSRVNINVTDGSKTVDSNVDAAMKKLESIEPEVENIDTKLAEAKALLNGNTSPEAKIVSLMIEIAESLADDDVANILTMTISDSSIESTSTLNKIVRSIATDLVDLDLKVDDSDQTVVLSDTVRAKLNMVADKLKSISDEFSNVFASSSDVYMYDGETMNYNDSLALRAGILSFAAQLKNLSSYQWGTDEDFYHRTRTSYKMVFEYNNFRINPSKVLNSGNFFKLDANVASTRLSQAKQNLIDASNLLSTLPVGYTPDDDSSGLLQEDKNDIEAIRNSLNGVSTFKVDVNDDEEIKEIEFDLSKIFDASTAVDITSLGSSWQAICDRGELTAEKSAIWIKSGLYCRYREFSHIKDGYEFYNYYNVSADVVPQVKPTANNSKIDEIVRSITKIDNTKLTADGVINYIFEDNTASAFGIEWTNVKTDARYVVNGNDVREDKAFDNLKVDAYYSKGVDSRADANKNFANAKNEISAKLRLKDVDLTTSDTSGPIGRGSMIAYLNNINSSNENIKVIVELRKGEVKYKVYKYDSVGDNETEIKSGKLADVQTVYENESDGKLEVNVKTVDSSIKFNLKKLNGNGQTIETFTEQVINIDNSFDIGIDQVKFRSEVRLKGDDGTLYNTAYNATRLRVHSFDTVTPMATLTFPQLTSSEFLSVHENSYDTMTFNSSTNVLTGNEYEKDGAGNYELVSDGTFTINVTPDSSNDKRVTYVDPSTGEEGILTLTSTNLVTGYSNVTATKANMEVTKAATSLEWNRWDWGNGNPSYYNGNSDVAVTDLDSLVAGFTTTNPFHTQSEKYDEVMLKDNGDVVKAVKNTQSGNSHPTYERGTEVVGTWIKDTSNNQIKLTLDNEEIYLRVVNESSNYYIENVEKLLPGFVFSEEFISGAGLATYKSDKF